VSDQIIEPSEIIIEQDGTEKETISHVNPKIRFLARFFDYALFIFFLATVRYFITGSTDVIRHESFIPIQFFIWIPLEALLLYVWGTTPGKFFLKTKIIPKKRIKLDYMSALKRSFNVWFRGFGMGIPVINILCLMVAYQRLNFLQMTSWDRDEQTIVTHYPVGQWRIILASIVSFSGLVFYYMFKTSLS